MTRHIPVWRKGFYAGGVVYTSYTPIDGLTLLVRPHFIWLNHGEECQYKFTLVWHDNEVLHKYRLFNTAEEAKLSAKENWLSVYELIKGSCAFKDQIPAPSV